MGWIWVNYVETAQTPNIRYSQDYGGFSTLSKEQRQEIINLIFGDDGLKPGIIKMFLILSSNRGQTK